MRTSSSAVLCADIGSTFTKAALVDAADGAVLATAAHPTTLRTDVMDGVDAARTAAETAAGVRAAELLACSSAGGGLRLAVVGYERVVTAEAGRRVALTAGGRVVHLHAGPLDAGGLAALAGAAPDLVLLTGGTDGGNADVLLHNAAALAGGPAVPVVLAGNAAAAEPAAALLAAAGRPVTPTGNVLPAIGVLDPGPARTALREAFLRHVIGGRGLSRRADFTGLVRAATPDAVLTGVELLAATPARAAGEPVDVLVVDVGGATTDVYSALAPAGEDAVLDREVVATLRHARTVEGDLGVRSGAPGVVTAALAEALLERSEAPALARYADRVAAAPDHLPERPDEDVALAALAARIAVRRHGRPTGPGAAARPLRDVALVVGSGGVLRHHGAAARRAVLEPLLADHAGGWPVPDRATVAVDTRYLLFAAGLLAGPAPDAAERLAGTLIRDMSA